MTRDEGVALIKQQLGFLQVQDANIVTYLQLAQTTLEKGLVKPWFLISEDSYKRTTADEDRIAVPSNFLMEVEDAVLKYVPDDSEGIQDEVDLRKDEFDVLRANFRQTESGPPQAYALLGGYFRFFPRPDDDYLIRMIFYRKGLTLDSNIENEWLKEIPLFLLGKAGMMMASPLRDGPAIEIFKGWINEGQILLHTHDTARAEANTTPQMGGPT